MKRRAKPLGVLRGNLDIVTGRRIVGWAQDEDKPDKPVSLLIIIDDELAMRVPADAFRTDLLQAGVGDGRHGFDVRLKEKLDADEAHMIAIQREGDGLHLPGSPVLVAPMSAFEQALQDGLEIGGAAAELRSHIEMLSRQTDRLLQLLADRRSGLADRRAHEQFRARWQQGAAREAEQVVDAPAPRALMIDERLPVPGHDAGSNAVMSHAASLQRLGYAVTIAGADMTAGAGTAALERQGIAVCHAPWCASVEEVLRRESGAYDVVYLHRIGPAARYMPLVRHYMPRARVVYSVADLHHLRLARQAEVERRPELKALAQQVRARELVAAWSADAVITHSSAEAALLRRHAPTATVHVVPWAVASRPIEVPFKDRRGVAFIAHYGHEPNRDAALWLIEEIMPLVRREDPSITCVLAGTAMPDVLRRPRDGVIALGQVADLAEVFGRVRLTVAPLTYGAGIKGKVLDSLAAGVPCVCSPVAAEGLDLPAALAALTAPDAQGLATSIYRLHGDKVLNASCVAAGLEMVRTRLSERQVDRQLGQAVGLPAIYGDLPAEVIETAAQAV